MLHAVIMAGGAGTRFWPASRAHRPKQLLDLVAGQTMIQATVARLGSMVPTDRLLIVTNQRLVGPIASQLPDLPPAAIIGEPCKRDTAPCIGLAASLLLHQDPDATMVVMPADHLIEPDEAFQQSIHYAHQLVEAKPQRIVTFGIRPSYAAETFGYIEREQPLSDTPAGQTAAAPTYRVRKFHEKPSAEKAAEYLQAGNYYWNSGIFIWKAATIVDALGSFEPEMYAHIETIAKALGSATFEEVLQREFSAIKGKSIDYAVMERYSDVVVVEAPFQWDDVGSWQSLTRLLGTDADGNTLVGRHLALRTNGSIVRTDDTHLVVTLGMEDCIVVHTEDATLVANKKDEEAIRQVVQLLQEKGWTQYL